MKTLSRLFLVVVVAFCFVGGAQADTFFSGLVDVDATVAGGNNVAGANLFNAAVGTSYNNTWAPGIAPGAKTTALGFIGLTTATPGSGPLAGSPQGLATGSHGLVAVYALEGLIVPGPSPLTPANSFDPGDGIVPGGTLPDSSVTAAVGPAPGGVLRVYDRVPPHSANSIDPNSPNTWVPNPANLSEGLVAEVIVTHRADGYQQGLPLTQTTLFQAVDISRVNQFILDTSDAFGGIEGDLKFAFTDLFNVLGADAGSLFKNLLVDPGNADLVRTSLDLVANLDQEFTSANFPSLANLANIGAANALFDALLDAVFGPGNHEFSGDGLAAGDGLGSNFDNVTFGNNLAANGDAAPLNAGALVVPGGQFLQVVNPEPATVLIWILVGVIGVFAARNLKPAARAA